MKPRKIDQDLSSEDSQKISEVRNLFNNHPIKGNELAKRAYYRAFFDGHHYTKINKHDKSIVVPKRKRNQTHRSKVNLVASNVDISVSKILKESPMPTGVPMGLSDKDTSSARVATKFFQNAFERADQSLIDKFYGALTYANVYGTGWVYVNWNPDFYVKNDNGDYEVKIYDDFQVMCDPSATNYFDTKWMLYSYMEDKNVIEETYKDLKGKLDDWVSDDSDADRYRFSPADYMKKDGINEAFKGKVLVWEYWQMPTRANKKGELIVMINQDILAERKENGNPMAEYHPYSNPFVPVYWKKMPDKALGDSAVADQIPINKDLNALVSYGMQTMKKVGGAKTFVPKGAGLKAIDIGDGIGDLVEYSDTAGGKPPHTVAGIGIPSGYSDMRGYMGGAMQDVSGNHEVSQGGTPQGSSRISGSALKLLIDSEYIRQSPVMRRFKTSLKIVSEIIMRFIQDKYVEKRKLKIVGEGNEYELMDFSNADLDGAFDIKIQIGSAFDSSPSAKVEGLLNVWDRQILQSAEQGDPSAKKVLRSLEFGDTDVIMLREKLHRNKALWVKDMIINKKEVPNISSEDDHEIHIEVLTEALLSPDFYKKEKSEVQDELHKRIDEHKNFIMERNQQLQQLQRQGEDSPPASDANLNNQEQATNMSQGGEGGVV